ncbi:hypothetical protein V8B55DRAFT_1341183 [Mucor lusitanicus]|uniref:Uncharacterized protein n=2 Tax=Mucor circinelloides f. lusitanicus TaxID=29924 RepID=A0A168NPW3_MUCCL|nr:hypothetical protein FB192DRAFT_1475007 [Mucor lusitanicus]OAD06571.1 hypothetical protein MUCCIDRAFT_107147 [Mucor lusitanicus CBS 277.49]
MLSPFPLKDDCPKPRFFRGTFPHSLIFQKPDSSWYPLSAYGCNSLLSVVRDEYQNGVAAGMRIIRCVSPPPHLPVGSSVYHIEISFDGVESLQEALQRPLRSPDGTNIVQVYPTVGERDGRAYSLSIKKVRISGDATNIRKEIHEYLSDYGKVMSLHLHFTFDGNWFTGEACGILITPTNDDLRFQHDPRLEIESKSEYTIYDD